MIFALLLVQGYLAHKKMPPPWDHRRALGMVLLFGPRWTLFRMSEVHDLRLVDQEEDRTRMPTFSPQSTISSSLQSKKIVPDAFRQVENSP